MSSSKRPAGDPQPQAKNQRKGQGRRKTDQPRSTIATMAIAASFLFSGGLMVWSFSKPFRTGALGNEEASVPTAQNVRLEYEAKLTTEEYLDYAEDLDRKVFDALRDQSVGNQTALRELNKYQRARRRERMIENRKAQLEKMTSELGEGEAFLKGTVEWEYEQELKEFLNESDE